MTEEFPSTHACCITCGREGKDTREGSGITPLGPGLQRSGRREEPRGPCFLSVEADWMQFHPPDHHYAKQNRLKTGSILPVLILSSPGKHLSSGSPAIPLPCRTHWPDLSSRGPFSGRQCGAEEARGLRCRPNPWESAILHITAGWLLASFWTFLSLWPFLFRLHTFFFS